MTSIGDLPPETCLIVLKHLGYWDICSLQQSSRSWRELIQLNEGMIYHKLSAFHGFIPDLQCTLERAVKTLGSNLPIEQSWKSFFEQRARLELAWTGNNHMRVNTTVLSSEINDFILPVHRFKIDEDENFVINTSSGGGLMVRDLDTHELLFMLPIHRVRRYAHVEYSNGFIIFDRQGEAVEVWRRYNDARLDEDHERLANPDQFQLDSFKQAYKKCMDDSHSEHERHRGTFVPYAVLQQPQPTRAYRFVYPTLLLATSNTWLAFLWDVPSCSLSQTINITPSNRTLHPHELEAEPTFITYVEQSERHIFVCTQSKLLIFTREPVKKGESALVAFFPGDDVKLEEDGCSLVWDEEFSSETPSQFGPNDLITVGRDTLWLPRDPGARMFFLPHNRFVAVHVSPDGKDLVTISEQGRMYYIDNFERLCVRPAEDSSSSLPKREIVHWYTFRSPDGQPAFNLAFENGRIAVTSKDGIFLFTLNRPNHIFSNKIPESEVIHDGMKSFLSPVKKLTQFTHPLALEMTSWTALTADSFWTTWHPVVWGDEFEDSQEQTLVRVKMV